MPTNEFNYIEWTLAIQSARESPTNEECLHVAQSFLSPDGSSNIFTPGKIAFIVTIWLSFYFSSPIHEIWVLHRIFPRYSYYASLLTWGASFWRHRGFSYEGVIDSPLSMLMGPWDGRSPGGMFTRRRESGRIEERERRVEWLIKSVEEACAEDGDTSGEAGSTVFCFAACSVALSGVWVVMMYCHSQFWVVTWACRSTLPIFFGPLLAFLGTVMSLGTAPGYSKEHVFRVSRRPADVIVDDHISKATDTVGKVSSDTPSKSPSQAKDTPRKSSSVIISLVNPTQTPLDILSRLISLLSPVVFTWVTLSTLPIPNDPLVSLVMLVHQCVAMNRISTVLVLRWLKKKALGGHPVHHVVVLDEDELQNVIKGVMGLDLLVEEEDSMPFRGISGCGGYQKNKV